MCRDYFGKLEIMLQVLPLEANMAFGTSRLWFNEAHIDTAFPADLFDSDGTLGK